jgi:hypothetical protein
MAGDAFLSRFGVEAKKFVLSVREGAWSFVWRKGGRAFLMLFLGSLCTGWLLSTVEELVRFSVLRTSLRASGRV